MSFKIHGFSNKYMHYDYRIFIAHKYDFISYHIIPYLCFYNIIIVLIIVKVM